MTSSYVAGQGFPIGTIIWYEAILNLEAIAKTNVFSVSPPSDDLASPTTTSTWFPNPGQLYAAVSSLLAPPVILDAVTAGVQLAAGDSRGAMSSFTRGISRIGYGSNWTRNQNLRTLENSVILEEMKEDASSWSLMPRSRR